ncbi:GGDEF domain-containing protein [Alteromonadaceae bacterium BrNp21-10]|nr:GGDEF domain-containing protein [Alteromonadaceae bacterium BrNp21-10]
MQNGFLTLANRIGDFLDVSQDGYAIFSADDILIGCNQAFADIMFIEFDQIINQSFNQLFNIAYKNQQGPRIETHDIERWLEIANKKRRVREFRLFEVDLIDGRWFLMSEQLLPSGELLLQAKNITKQKVVEQTLFEHTHQLTSLAATDELTQIANRRSFIGKVNSEINRCKRSNHKLTFCLLDIDHFKKINDRYGHQVGDNVLRQLASLVKKALREYDHFGRIGGEEFGILLPDTTAAEAEEITNRLCSQIMTTTFNDEDNPVNITLSVGLIESWPDCTFELLYNQSDIALYQAKDNGRNQVVTQDPVKSVTD